MNANELADINEWSCCAYSKEVSAMLRQQQTEIKALKQIIDANNLSQNIGQFVKPTNEPVAYVDNVWINRPDLAMDLGIGQMFSKCQLSDYQIPLYTHLVKELTDEEIEDECRKAWGLHDQDQLNLEEVFKFARAILRKAQEK